MHAKRINGYDYYYMSVRRKGKITTVYLGQVPGKAKEREGAIKARLRIGKLGRPHKFDRNPRYIQDSTGSDHPHPASRREKRRVSRPEKGQASPLIIVPVIFALAAAFMLISIQADVSFSITVTSPSNQTYTIQDVNLNVTTGDIADACQYHLDTGSNTTLSNDSSTNWFAVISATDGYHNLSVYCNDSAGEWGLNSSISFTRDTQPPYWTNNKTSAQSAYSSTQESCMNVTWQDSTSGVHTVYIEGNWSGSAANYTAANVSSEFYYCSILPAGTFYWKSWANDTSGLLNYTDTWVFTIGQAENPIYLWLNGSQENMTASYGEITNATAYISFGSVALFRNDESVSNPDIQDFGAGTYVYLANSSGDSNHTANSTYLGLEVSRATAYITLEVTPSSPTTYGTPITPACQINASEPSAILYMNGSEISNSTAYTLAAGTYNFTCNSSQTENYTAAENYTNHEITRAPMTLSLFLNSSQSNLSQTYGETINATGYKSYSEGSLTLYRNGSEVSNPDISDLGAGYWNYTLEFAQTENYSDNSTSLFATVEKANNPIYLYLNGSESNLTASYGETTSATAYVSFGSVSLYRDLESVSNPDIQDLGAGTYVYLANSSGDGNHTANSTVFNVTVLKAASTTTVYLNGSSSDQAITYGETVNATAYADFGTITLYLNETEVSNPYLENPGAGYYNFTAYSSGDANHSASEDTVFLTVNKASNPIYLYLNLSQSNLSVSYGDTTSATASISYGSVSIFMNEEPVSNPDVNELGVGVYVYVANSSGDDNHTANSTAYNITVNQIPSVTSLFLNESQDNLTQTYGETINATAYCDYGTPTLYLNSSSVSSQFESVLGYSYYNFTAYCPGDSNHSLSEKSYFLTVNKAPNPIYLYLNDLQSNLTVTFGNTTNASAYISFGSVSLFMNGESVSNPDIQDFGVGTYVYVADSTGDDNHTANSTVYNITITYAPMPLFLLLNDSESDQSYTYGETTKASGYKSYLEGLPTLYRNGTQVENPEITELPAGYWNYTLEFIQAENYATNTTVLYATVNKASNPIYLYLNDSQSNLTTTYGNTTNATAYISFGAVSLFRNGESVSNPDIQNLAAGTYIYTANSTGDDNHTENSTYFGLTVNKISSTTSLFLNTSQGNLTITYGQTVNATAYCDYGTPYIQLNASNISNPYLGTIAASYYNFTAYCPGDTNHSSSEKSYFLTVSKGSTNLSFSISPSSPSTYGTPITATCMANNSEVTANLYRNGSFISENGSSVILAAGTYNYTCNCSATGNYTGAQNYTIHQINRVNMTTQLYLNGSQSSLTTTYGNTINATGYKSYSEGSLKLYRNGTEVSNPEITEIPAGYWNYTVIFEQTENYSSNYTTRFATVNKASNPIYLYLNGSQSSLTVTYGNTTNASAYVSFGSVELYRNETQVSSPDISDLGAGYYLYKANSSGDTNHTSNSTSFSLTVNKVSFMASLYLNGSQDNLTITYGETANATAYCDYGTASLSLNGTAVSNPYMGNPGGGYWNFTANCSGDSNHSSSEKTLFLTVNKVSTNMTLLINGTDGNFQSERESSINFTAYLSPNQSTAIFLYQNGTYLASGSSALESVSYYASTGTYNISANYSGNQNYTSIQAYHILNMVDTTKPVVVFSLPTNPNQSVTGFDWFYVYATANEDPSTCLLDWYNGTWTNVSMEVVGGYICRVDMGDLSDYGYYFRVYASDLAGNWNVTDDRLITVDTTKPNPIFTSPTLSNKTNSINKYIEVNVSAGETLSNCSLNWNGTNQSYASSGKYCYINKTGLGDGSYYFKVYANDSGGNINVTEDRKITTGPPDTDPPQLWFTSPSSNGSTTSSSWISVNVSADEDLDTCLLDWYNGTWQNMSMNVTDESCYLSMTGLSQGYYYFRVYGNDTAGNLNVTEDRQIRYYVAPSQPSGDTQNYGGGGPVILPQPNVTQVPPEPAIKTVSIHLEISPGEKNVTGIRLKNTLNVTQTFTGRITGNITSLLLNRTFTFTLVPGEEREINIHVDVVKGMALGTYSGEVQIISGSERYSIPVTVRVVEAEALNIRITPIQAEAAPGDIAQFYVTLHNAGYAKSVRLVLELLGPDDVVIATSEEILRVEGGSAAGSITIPSYLAEGTYPIRATASYTDSDNNTISALASDYITVRKRIGWWTMELVSWINLTYLAIGAVFLTLLLILAIRVKHRKDFEVKVVNIKKEDMALTTQVARFLRKYSSIPKPKKQGKPWKIPAKSAGEEQPPKKPEKKHPPKPENHAPKKRTPSPMQKEEPEEHKAAKPEPISNGRRHETPSGHEVPKHEHHKAEKPHTRQAEPSKSSVDRLMEEVSRRKASAPASQKKEPIRVRAAPPGTPKQISDGRRTDQDSRPEPAESGKESDREIVESLRSEIRYIQSNLEALGGEDVSSLQKAADRLRRTLNLGEALGHETLEKTRKNVEKLKKEYQAAAARE